MAVQFLNVPEPIQRKSSALKNFSNAIGESLNQYGNEKRENEAIKRLSGLDVQGIQDPNLRNAFIADELAVRRNERAEKLSLEKSKRLAEVKKNTKPTPSEIPVGGISTGKEGVSPSGREPRRPKAVKNLTEMEDEAARITDEKLAQNINTDYETELNNIITLNTAQKLENQEIEQQQQALSNLYEEKLKNVIPGATDEVSILASQKAQGAFDSGKNYPEVQKDAQEYAKEVGNKISRINNSIKALSEPFDKAKMSLRNNVKPLLDLGLNDTARNILDKNGYTPEQVESVITDLGENTRKSLTQLPDFKAKYIDPVTGKEVMYGLPREKKLDEQEEARFRNSLSEILSKDPSTNLILLREAYKNKNIEWFEFRKAIDDMIADGSLKLNAQQWENKKYIDEPPMEGLNKLWKQFKGYFK